MQTKYITDVDVTSSSGGAVMFTRTREPFRCMEALQEYAFSKSWSYKQWNVKDGVTTTNAGDDPNADNTGDGNVDVYGALVAEVESMVAETDGSMLVLFGVHHWLGQIPALTEALRQYARKLSMTANKRVVIVVPEGVTLDQELRHDIPVIDYDLPTRDELKETFSYCMESSFRDGEEVFQVFPDHEIETLVSSASGMTEMEAELAFSKAVVMQRDSFPNMEFIPFNDIVLKQKTEIVKQSEVLEMMDSIPMSDVGGLEGFKEWIGSASKCFTKEAEEFGVARPKGIVAIGPAGTGKSLLAKATGSALHMPIVKFDVARIYGSLVGQSEERARMAIKMLEAMAPCVALIDEIDKGLGGAHQGGGDSGVSKRILGIILTAMQESTAPIFWIASANRVDSLPAELLRKGRFDEVFSVLEPHRVEREAIIQIHLQKCNQDLETVGDLTPAIKSSKGFVGAEIEAAVKEATKTAFVKGVDVSGEGIARELAGFKPLKEAFPEDFAAMHKWAKDNGKPSSHPLDEEEVEEAPKAARPRRRAISKK